MDLSKIAGQVKGFQRKATQKVMQQMGMGDKTDEESHILFRNSTYHTTSPHSKSQRI